MFNKVKEHRINCNMSQGQLAKKLGVSRTTVSNLERGVFDTSGSLMLTAAKVFGKPVEQIFYLDNVKHEKQKSVI